MTRAISFRRKLILGIAAIQLASLSAMILDDVQTLRRSSEDQLVKRAAVASAMMAAAAKDAVLATDLATLDRVVAELMRTPDLVYVRVRAADGGVLAAAGEDGALARPFVADTTLAAVRNQIFNVSRDITAAGQSFGRVELGISIRAIEAARRTALYWGGGMAIAGLALVALFSSLLGTYLTRGLDRLRQGVRSMEGGVLGTQVAVGGGDELAELTAAFNHMSATVAKLYAEVRTSHEALADHAALLAGQHDNLARSNAELEQFAYVASHDLRQPLRMITSYLGLIEKRVGPRLGDDTKEFLAFAVDGAKRLDRLILDLLDYSRIDKATKSAPVALAKVLDDAILNLSVAIRENDAEIAVAGDWPTVKGNATELTRLFQNLIGNAVKYRAPERRAKVEIGCGRQGRQWLITVKDNGIGIAPDDHDRAFAIFQRLVTQGEYDGTGIGLAVCKKIVEHHGGKIWIDSTVGTGSTFFLTLPA